MSAPLTYSELIVTKFLMNADLDYSLRYARPTLHARPDSNCYTAIQDEDISSNDYDTRRDVPQSKARIHHWH